MILKIIMSKIVKNSLWGIVANIFQNLFYSIFFVIVARKYSTDDFSNYILANTIYGFVLAFSSLGLGQWFIRALKTTQDKEELIHSFFKIQIIIGFVFYLVNVLIVYSIYDSWMIRELSLLIGINVVFDNIIYVIKNINIAYMQQRKSFSIITVEAFLKLLFGVLLFYTSIPIVSLAFFLILLRILTLNLFLNIGTTFHLNVSSLFKAKLNIAVIKEIVYANWPFIIIGSLSVVYWRIGNIIISKYLPLKDVAEYEISFKLFSLAETVPIIISSTVFPVLVEKVKEGNLFAKNIFKMTFPFYAIYGLLSFTFIATFSGYFIPLLFGKNYTGVSFHTIEMFLTMLIFPTALLQANLLIALQMEKVDMWFNIISLIINLAISFIGIQLFKTLSVINYAIFFSFILFHIFQDIVLYKQRLVSLKEIMVHYFLLCTTVFLYYFMSSLFSNYIGFFVFWTILCFIILFIHFRVSTFKLYPIKM